MGRIGHSDCLLREGHRNTTCDEIPSKMDLHQHWASLYNVRFEKCESIRGMVSGHIGGHRPSDGDGHYHAFVIVRENGRILLDIHGNPAVFTSQVEAERWLMPDEQVRAHR